MRGLRRPLRRSVEVVVVLGGTVERRLRKLFRRRVGGPCQDALPDRGASRLHGDADFLVLLERQRFRRLEHAILVDSFDRKSHRLVLREERAVDEAIVALAAYGGSSQRLLETHHRLLIGFQDATGQGEWTGN